MSSQWVLRYLLPAPQHLLVPPELDGGRVVEDLKIHPCPVLEQILCQILVRGHVLANDLSTTHSSCEDPCPAIDHHVPRILPLSEHMTDLSRVAADRLVGLFGLVRGSEMVDGMWMQ